MCNPPEGISLRKREKKDEEFRQIFSPVSEKLQMTESLKGKGNLRDKISKKRDSKTTDKDNEKWWGSRKRRWEPLGPLCRAHRRKAGNGGWRHQVAGVLGSPGEACRPGREDKYIHGQGCNSSSLWSSS